jgi:hypothetical protein
MNRNSTPDPRIGRAFPFTHRLRGVVAASTLWVGLASPIAFAGPSLPDESFATVPADPPAVDEPAGTPRPHDFILRNGID